MALDQHNQIPFFLHEEAGFSDDSLQFLSDDGSPENLLNAFPFGGIESYPDPVSEEEFMAAMLNLPSGVLSDPIQLDLTPDYLSYGSELSSPLRSDDVSSPIESGSDSSPIHTDACAGEVPLIMFHTTEYDVKSSNLTKIWIYYKVIQLQIKLQGMWLNPSVWEGLSEGCRLQVVIQKYDKQGNSIGFCDESIIYQRKAGKSSPVDFPHITYDQVNKTHRISFYIGSTCHKVGCEYFSISMQMVPLTGEGNEGYALPQQISPLFTVRSKNKDVAVPQKVLKVEELPETESLQVVAPSSVMTQGPSHLNVPWLNEESLVPLLQPPGYTIESNLTGVWVNYRAVMLTIKGKTSASHMKVLVGKYHKDGTALPNFCEDSILYQRKKGKNEPMLPIAIPSSKSNKGVKTSFYFNSTSPRENCTFFALFLQEMSATGESKNPVQISQLFSVKSKTKAQIQNRSEKLQSKKRSMDAPPERLTKAKMEVASPIQVYDPSVKMEPMEPSDMILSDFNLDPIILQEFSAGLQEDLPHSHPHISQYRPTNLETSNTTKRNAFIPRINRPDQPDHPDRIPHSKQEVQQEEEEVIVPSPPQRQEKEESKGVLSRMTSMIKESLPKAKYERVDTSSKEEMDEEEERLYYQKKTSHRRRSPELEEADTVARTKDLYRDEHPHRYRDPNKENVMRRGMEVPQEDEITVVQPQEQVYIAEAETITKEEVRIGALGYARISNSTHNFLQLYWRWSLANLTFGFGYVVVLFNMILSAVAIRLGDPSDAWVTLPSQIVTPVAVSLMFCTCIYELKIQNLHPPHEGVWMWMALRSLITFSTAFLDSAILYWFMLPTCVMLMVTSLLMMVLAFKFRRNYEASRLCPTDV
eukprot:TRINITY_DN6119_c0_g1_i2.p1 TRINITY_DN6119_c0_g1~~TRINITY_DN6119_c0_g1_i2.p1  ORF type:complete len:868 (-),score=181.43 TRINITY_DN6119_c0_g1_i2:50-2653(-)